MSKTLGKFFFGFTSATHVVFLRLVFVAGVLCANPFLRGASDAPAEPISEPPASAFAPGFSSQTFSQTVVAGTNVSFSVSATGNPTPTLQWQRLPFGSVTWENLSNAGAYTGTTSSSLNISVATTAMNGDQFRCLATNTEAVTASVAAVLTVNAAVAPGVYGLLANIVLSYGGSLTMFPTTTGSDPKTFQWKKDGVAIVGAINSFYIQSYVTTADSGQYEVVVTNYGGSTTSTIMTVLVNPAVAPSLYNLPAAISIDSGVALNLSPSIVGTLPMTFQWKKDGVNIVGAVNSTFSKNAAIADEGVYTLTATNVAGTTVSSAVTVTVNPLVAPVIFNLPSATTLESGNNLNLSPAITGSQPMTFQWKKDGVAISGATSNSYFKSNVTGADAGVYTLTAVNAAGTTVSSNVTVTVTSAVAPAIFNLPTAITINFGTSLSLSAQTTGTQPITLQWKKDGAAIAGATNSFYFKSTATGADAGVYTLTAVNAGGTTVSGNVTVTVNPAVAPTIFNLAPTPIIDAGTTISLLPTVAGSQPMTFQWKKDGAAIFGATSSSYFKSNATGADAGVYTLTAVNAGGTTISGNITVTVNPIVAPAIFNLPAAVMVEYAVGFNLSPTITGTQPMTFQWKKGGVLLAGGNDNSYSKSVPTPADNGIYTLTVTNAAGTTVSSNVTVTVNPAIAPAIFNLLTTVVVDAGGNITFSPSIVGTLPMTFQWKKDGTNLSNGTNSFYSKTGLTPTDSGVYTLSATNVVGTTVSANVNVTVNPVIAPAIFNLSATVTVEYGSNLSLSPSITGTQPMTLQWKKDGVAIAGATSASYFKGGATTADNGVYTLTATNAGGTTTSANTTVAVNPATAPGIFNLLPVIILEQGTGLFLTPAVTGTPTISYQWKKDGVAIPSATNAFYTKTGVTTADNGVYTLTATNLAGTTVSSNVSVTVNPAIAPVIFNLPSVLTVSYGNNIGFSPAVNGTPAITYQWKKDGVPIPFATSISFTKTNPTPTDSGVYTLTATNLAGSTSANVTVTVNPAAAPVITNLPPTKTVELGGTLELVATVTGTFPIGYSWKKDGVLVGAGSNFYFRGGVTAAESGVYTLTATNFVGTTTSLNVVVTVNPPSAPLISGLPSTLKINYGWGSSIFLAPVVTGSQPITYSWKKNGVSIAGATSSSFAKLNISAADHGAYTLTATNNVGTTVSSTVTVVVEGFSDFNNDGYADLLWQNPVTGQRGVWLMSGTAVSTYFALDPVGPPWQIAGSGDFNGDGRPDIIWQNPDTGQRGIWLMNGTTVLSYAALDPVGPPWQIAGTADFNNDGNTDIIWQNPDTGQRGIWLMNGTTVVSYVAIDSLGSALQIAGAADFNGDGYPDILLQNLVTGQRGISLMNGTNVSTFIALDSVGAPWQIVGSADLNGDGRPDILWQNPDTGQRGAWLMNGTTVSTYVAFDPVGPPWQMHQ